MGAHHGNDTTIHRATQSGGLAWCQGRSSPEWAHETFPHARAVCRHSAWAQARAADYHDEISVSPGDLREQARGFQPGELLVESAGVIDLRVDCRRNIRGIDGLHDVGQDETAGRCEPAGDASEEIGLSSAFEVMNCKSRYDEVERPFRQGILQSAYE
jgi:hypothetical protein